MKKISSAMRWERADKRLKVLKIQIRLAIEEWTEAKIALLGEMRGTGPSISRREAEVLIAVQGHLTNKEIASQLNISVSTVKWHVASLFKKYDVTRRSELAKEEF